MEPHISQVGMQNMQPLWKMAWWFLKNFTQTHYRAQPFHSKVYTPERRKIDQTLVHTAILAPQINSGNSLNVCQRMNGHAHCDEST